MRLPPVGAPGSQVKQLRSQASFAFDASYVCRWMFCGLSSRSTRAGRCDRPRTRGSGAWSARMSWSRASAFGARPGRASCSPPRGGVRIRCIGAARGHRIAPAANVEQLRVDESDRGRLSDTFRPSDLGLDRRARDGGDEPRLWAGSRHRATAGRRGPRARRPERCQRPRSGERER